MMQDSVLVNVVKRISLFISLVTVLLGVAAVSVPVAAVTCGVARLILLLFVPDMSCDQQRADDRKTDAVGCV